MYVRDVISLFCRFFIFFSFKSFPFSLALTLLVSPEVWQEAIDRRKIERCWYRSALVARSRCTDSINAPRSQPIWILFDVYLCLHSGECLGAYVSSSLLYTNSIFLRQRPLDNAVASSHDTETIPLLRQRWKDPARSNPPCVRYGRKRKKTHIRVIEILVTSPWREGEKKK